MALMKRLDPRLRIIFGVTIVSILGMSPITPAFPRMIKFFHIAPSAIGLVIAFFALPGIVMTPLYGVLADRVGRKGALLFALVVYGLGGTACGLVSDFKVFLAMRFVQGMGASGLGALATTLIGDLYSGHKRTDFMGYNASILSVGTALFPAAGGLLSQFSWRYPFFLNLFAFVAVYWVLKEFNFPSLQKEKCPFKDYLKNAFHGISDRKAIWLFAGGSAIYFLIMGSYVTYIPVLMSHRFKSQPWEIGVVLAAGSIGAGIAAAITGKLARMWGHTFLIRISFAGFLGTFALIPLMKSTWALLLPAILFGSANGIAFPLIQSVIVALAPFKYRGAFVSFNGMILRYSQVISPVVFAGVYSAFGIDFVFYGAALLSIFFGIASVFSPDFDSVGLSDVVTD